MDYNLRKEAVIRRDLRPDVRRRRPDPSGTVRRRRRILVAVIEISRQAYAQMIGAALDAYPFEACGLIAGPPSADGGAGDRAPIFYPCTNVAESARVYTIDPKDHLRAEMRCRRPRLRDQRCGAQPHPLRAVPESHGRGVGARPVVALRDRQPQTRGARGAQLPDPRRHDHRRARRDRLTGRGCQALGTRGPCERRRRFHWCVFTRIGGRVAGQSGRQVRFLTETIGLVGMSASAGMVLGEL